ncbi:MAG TPA: response regulator [Lacunisphaera sp.]|nr:response regulator [Lacunisphaera sp.]
MSSGNILLVDDDVPLARGLADFLRRRGYHVIMASGGREAMKLLERHPVSLVVSDIFMPDRDGLELLTHLRRTAPAIPVLAMSGSWCARVEGMLEMAAALGAARTLPKPFAPLELLLLVEDLIGPPAGQPRDDPSEASAG